MSHRLFRWFLIVATGVIVVGGGGCGNAPAANPGAASTSTAAHEVNSVGTTTVQPTAPSIASPGSSPTPAPAGKAVFLIMMES